MRFDIFEYRALKTIENVTKKIESKFKKTFIKQQRLFY